MPYVEPVGHPATGANHQLRAERETDSLPTSWSAPVIVDPARVGSGATARAWAYAVTEPDGQQFATHVD